MKKVQWFSLMETIIIVILLGLLIQANRVLFTIPSKYIIESERCVNTIHGEVGRFFYESITGKTKTEQNSWNFSAIPEQYSITFDWWTPNYEIDFWFTTRSSTWIIGTTSIKKILLGSWLNENNTPWCIGPTHRVMLSGWVNDGWVIYPMKVLVNKNLSTQNSSNAMSICAADSWNNHNCRSWSNIFTGVINYMICKTNNETTNNDCNLFFSEHIDTRSQTIFSRRCLSLPIDKPCERRSIESVE